MTTTDEQVHPLTDLQRSVLVTLNEAGPSTANEVVSAHRERAGEHRSLPSIRQHLTVLVEKGFVRKERQPFERGEAGAYRVTPDGREELQR